jgi:heme/copper-type cytochrome/quinol oxidase subunit 4
MGTRNGLVYNIYMNQKKVDQSVRILTGFFGIIIAIIIVAAIIG